jgi:hypothetical protein
VRKSSGASNGAVTTKMKLILLDLLILAILVLDGVNIRNYVNSGLVCAASKAHNKRPRKPFGHNALCTLVACTLGRVPLGSVMDALLCIDPSIQRRGGNRTR